MLSACVCFIYFPSSRIGDLAVPVEEHLLCPALLTSHFSRSLSEGHVPPPRRVYC